MCREIYIEIFGWDQVLEEMLNDLKILESEGIQFSYKGRIDYYHGTLLTILGDNLGSHSISGFTENFSTSTHFCRFCEIPRKNLKSGNYTVHNLRDVTSYEANSQEAREENSMHLGVKRNSPLNTLKYYHVCNPGLPPCAAYDLWEKGSFLRFSDCN